MTNHGIPQYKPTSEEILTAMITAREAIEKIAGIALWKDDGDGTMTLITNITQPEPDLYETRGA